MKNKILVLIGMFFLSIPSLIQAQEKSGSSSEDNYHDDADDSDIDAQIYDPFEETNRAIFTFNDFVDRNLVEPVARGYSKALPDQFEIGIKNFFNNLLYPRFLLSDLIQLDLDKAIKHTGRFVINTTMGIGGLIDVAKDFELKEQREDVGIALARYGVGHGPFIIMPFLGPFTLRDLVGECADRAVHPFQILQYADAGTPITDRTSYIGGPTEIISKRARLIKAVEAAKESSLDYYGFVRAAYYQNRQGVMNSGKLSENNVTQ